MTTCLWCERQFEGREKGGSPQRFCSAACRSEYHTACRQFADGLVMGGAITVDALKEAVKLTSLSAVEKRARFLKAEPAP